jgi:peptide/nickel transport system substrate-binding protein
MPDIQPDQPDSQPFSSSETPELTPTPAPAPVPPSSPEPAPVEPVTAPVSGNGGRKGHKKMLAFLLLLVVVAAAVVIGYSVKPQNAQAPAANKKDIPYLTYGLSGSGFDDLYPNSATGSNAQIQINAQLFEGLVRYQQQTKIVPLLATSWSNPNDTTWVFNLRKDVKFHSGRAMTAQDVKSSLDYAIAHQNDAEGSSFFASASTIKTVTVVNSHQVKIATDGPDPTLLNRLSGLYVFDTKAAANDPNSGTGPYTVKAGTKPTASSIDLTAVTNYWGGHIYTRAIHIASVTDSSKLGADTNNGQFDLAGDFPDTVLAKIKAYKTISIQDLGVTFVGLNTLKADSPLQSLQARQAAAYALNVPAILKAGSLRGTQVSQLVPSTIPGYDSSIHNTPYDVAKAKTLLASVKNASAPLTLSFLTGDEAPVAEVAKELNAVGFNVKTVALPDTNALITQGLGGETDMFYAGYSSNILDGLDIINSIVVGNKDYTNTEVETLAKKASSTLDPSARIAILQKIERQVATDVPDIPLFTQTQVFVLQKPYHVQVELPSTEVGAYFWQVYQQ